MTTTGNKPKYRQTALVPTSTVNQHRLQLFQPTRRPVEKKEVVVTAHGKISIDGKLGQAHADVLAAIMYCAEKKQEVDGRIKLLVDPAKIRKTAGLSGGTQFDKLITDLQKAIITISEPATLGACIGHIIDHVDIAQRRDGTPITRANPLNRGERKIWSVELGKALCQLIKDDIWLTYNPAPIAALNSGISQAVARHILSHKKEPQGGWRLDTLIVAVAGELDDTNMRHRRRELRADAAALAEIGIQIKEDRVYKSK